ncbi:hypothetical protein FZI85_25170 [Mycobacterium sp. CBMA293]|uniref:hypothetical protein n=1 Tax=unclassified Mycolicibacterium TaxID=2636767 RepID=UPI0012DE9CB4|nr:MULTISPECIES: hypothetical protein [unclassified Mycolicibacterium]MUL47609.1 hypothetical protein [Mycolicibacterium sp. CBMA 360]MUL61873.1 hypothetical protein [Mycolicibacterium sp. CBMA 335]MUL68946.1 hypothetical protein [Mycolicibacterium sp. CBMA 311]MUL92837.1 hypothetical protein [Mycolicibacterium sp. CBMA 230]MUM08721.1 hypothetical protein [Mycolicibacterium sp. CBMA 213]
MAQRRRYRLGGIVRLARIVTDDLFAGPLRRDLIRDRLTLDELGWQGLADYINHAPPGTALRHAIDEERERERADGGWSVNDHLAAVLIDKVEELIWWFRRANFEGNPEFPDPIQRPGVDADESGPAWSDEKIAAMVPTMASIMGG